jgi:hypothetical protein
MRLQSQENSTCGIAGYVGKSKHPKITYKLATRLFERSETRGSDASGYWGCQSGDDGAVVYHKEPRKSTQFVHGEQWKRLGEMDLNILVMHARQSSQGMGDASFNKNNHPFTNNDKSLGLVHNGRIYEYTSLKKRYQVKSDCDSEILLRIFEQSRQDAQIPEPRGEDFKAPDDICQSMMGIRQIFSYVNDSHMAVAIGERGEASRRDLWLFHNEKRPLWVIDARKVLGQVFFCSTPDIWRNALNDCPQAVSLLGGKKHMVCQMPTEEIWFFSIDDNATEVKDQGQGYYRWVLHGENHFTSWEDEGPMFPVVQGSRQVPVLCDLGDNDEIKNISMPLSNKQIKRNNRRHHKNKYSYDNNNQWHDQGEAASPKKVDWSSSRPRLEDERSSDDDEEMDTYNDSPDDIDDDDLREEGLLNEEYHGMNPLRFNEDHQIVPAERAVGRALSRSRPDVGYDSYNDNSNSDSSSFDLPALDKVVAEMKQTIDNIHVSAQNLAHEGSLTPAQFQDNLDTLKMHLDDIKGALIMLEGY